MNKPAHHSLPFTAAGLLAIVLWSTTIGLARSLAEKLGLFTAAGSIYLGAGCLGMVWLACSRTRLRKLRGLPVRYLVGCGGLCILYMICLAIAIGKARSRSQVVEAGIINYMWPGLTLAFSVPLLGKKAKAALPLGILFAFAGVAIAASGQSGLSLGRFLDNLKASRVPYGCAFVGAVTWALYSNLSRRWAGNSEGSAMPVFMLIAGAILLGLRFVVGESSQWSSSVGMELAYMIALPTFLAYNLWDAAMRRGNLVLVAACSYFTPLLSTLVTVVYLRVAANPRLWVACALVVAGAVTCKFSIVERPPASREDQTLSRDG